MLEHYNNDAFERSMIFVQWIFSIASLSFFYISVRVIVWKEEILCVGSPEFVGYAVYEFAIAAGYFFRMVCYGIEANKSVY